MAKTQEELNQLINEYRTLNTKLKELSDDELRLVTGGVTVDEYYSNMKGNAPYVKLYLASGGWLAIGFSVHKISDGGDYINTGFNNGIENGVKYTDYFFINKDNPNIKFLVHASDVNNGTYLDNDLK